MLLDSPQGKAARYGFSTRIQIHCYKVYADLAEIDHCYVKCRMLESVKKNWNLI